MKETTMNNLTTEQLTELTERINARLAEFGTLLAMPKLAPGVVRMAHDVIAEWRAQESSDFALLHDEDGRTYEQTPWSHLMVASEPEPEAVATVTPEVKPYTNGHTNDNGTKPSLSAQVTATLGPEHTVVTPIKYAHLPTFDELVAEVKRQAMGGVMPTMAAFDMARPAVWATAQAHLVRLNLTWSDLAQEAGLTLKRGK